MEEKLTKAAIIESLHNKLSLSRADIHRVIDELFEEIKDGLKEDRVIELRGFGTFEVSERAQLYHRLEDHLPDSKGRFRYAG